MHGGKKNMEKPETKLDPTRILPEFLNLSEMKAKLELSERTIKEYVADGTLPKPRKLGSKYFWVTKEVSKYISLAKLPSP